MTGKRIEVTGYAVVPVPDEVRAEYPTRSGSWWWLVDHNNEPVTRGWIAGSELALRFNISPDAIPLKRGDRVADSREYGTVIAADGELAWWKSDNGGNFISGRTDLTLITGDES